jgi:hypothetical protein
VHIYVRCHASKHARRLGVFYDVLATLFHYFCYSFALVPIMINDCTELQSTDRQSSRAEAICFDTYSETVRHHAIVVESKS